MFTVKRYSTQQFGTSETLLEGGDLFHLVNSSVALNVKFYNQAKSVIGQVSGITALKLNFFDGVLLKQSLDKKIAEGNNLPDLGRSFAWVGVSAASNVTPEIIVTSGGIDSESFAFAGNINVLPNSSVLGRAAIAMVDTNTQTIAANSSRKGLFIVNAATSGSGALWVSDAAAASDGVPVFPGGNIYLPVTGAVQVYSDQANTLAVLEVL